MANEKQLLIQVRDKIATLKSKNFNLVGGNSDYDVVFDFDEDWDNYPIKTAVFVFGKNEPIKQVVEGNICKGVAINGSTMCLIGVFAGDLITTTPACVECVYRSILDEADGTPQPPTEDIYNQIMDLLNRYINAVKGAPSGGTKGQVLKKNSDEDYDYSWQDDVVGESQAKEVQNITSIDTIYEDASKLPSTAPNGTRLVSLTNGKLPLVINSFSSATGEWSIVDECRGSTIYIVLTGEKRGTYRFTMSAPYLVSLESHTLEEAKKYTDDSIKKYHEENPVKDGYTPQKATKPR